VSLQDIQQENAAGSTLRTIVTDLDLINEGERISAVFERSEPILIELATGEIVSPEKYDGELNVEEFDIQRLAVHPEYGMAIPEGKDIARIGRMPKYMRIFIIRERGGEKIEKYAFPIYGQGLYSTMRGAIALKPDLVTVDSISFYEHAETPGLGGEIENTQWKNSWRGKTALDADGKILIEVLTGAVNPASPRAASQIDGLSGATRTTRGVDQLVKFWLGEDGYGPFLNKRRGS
jgi:Na+-transporting NADH:ubiquinone oxidoreductase subunit C